MLLSAFGRGETKMERRAVRALESVQRHDMLVLRADDAERYTGAGSTVGATLALAHEDIKADRHGEVRPFLAIDPAAQPLGTEDEPPPEMSEHEQRVFDAQVGRIWARLSQAANTLAKAVRGQQTVAFQGDSDDIIARSTSTWKAFGFILDCDHRQIWGWTRTTFAIKPLPLQLRVMRGQLRLLLDGRELSEVELVQRLEQDLSS